MKLVKGIAELFHQVFCLKDRKISVLDHVWVLFGVGTWISLLSWTLPSCWLFWGIALNVFCRCCSRLWTTGALGTRELILDCGVMEAGGTWGILLVLLFVFHISIFKTFWSSSERSEQIQVYEIGWSALCDIFHLEALNSTCAQGVLAGRSGVCDAPHNRWHGGTDSSGMAIHTSVS